MTFTIHITHRHIEGAGLHNEYYERIEPCDEDIAIEIDDEEVHRDVEDMIINDYFIADLRASEREVIKTVLHALMGDLDMYDKAIKVYFDELHDKYERKYNHDNR